MKTLFLLLIIVLVSSGCVTAKQDLYYWGQYESLLLKMYVKQDSVDPDSQIERLSRDLEIAESQGKQVPPGVFLHLGFMYAMKGEPAQAETAFNNEQERFPESSVFIDGMMKRAYNQAEQNRSQDE